MDVILMIIAEVGVTVIGGGIVKNHFRSTLKEYRKHFGTAFEIFPGERVVVAIQRLNGSMFVVDSVEQLFRNRFKIRGGIDMVVAIPPELWSKIQTGTEPQKILDLT